MMDEIKIISVDELSKLDVVYVTRLVKASLKICDGITVENVQVGIEFVKRLDALGKKLCAFDMDYTANKLHSGGVINRTNLEKYCRNASTDFLIAIVLLTLVGKSVAILSFTDKTYNTYNKYPKETHCAGEDLIKCFIDANFNEGIADKIFYYGYNPNLHKEPRTKHKHISKFTAHCNETDNTKVILFDDTEIIVKTSYVTAFHVNNNKAFQFTDLP